MASKFKIVAIWLRILCAVALVCIGFAHRIPMANAAPSAQELAAYSLPDGSLPVLCITQDDSSSGKQSTISDKSCDACRLNASTDLPTPAVLDIPSLKPMRQAILPVRFEAFTRQLFPPNAAPRAPPAVSLIV